MRFSWLSYQSPKSDQDPDWISKVPRSNQLDRFANGIMDLYWENRKGLKLPDIIFLASPLASNQTDFEYIRDDYSSPSKFVHSLPNMRVLPFVQYTNWIGPLYCIQNGSSTIVSAILEALEESKFNNNVVWVLSSMESSKESKLSENYLFEFNSNRALTSGFLVEPEINPNGLLKDKQWIEFLTNEDLGSIYLNSVMKVFRND